MRSSPTPPLLKAHQTPSIFLSVSGTQPVRCSVITNCRFGNRSKTPERITCQRLRFAKNGTSMIIRKFLILAVL